MEFERALHDRKVKAARKQGPVTALQKRVVLAALANLCAERGYPALAEDYAYRARKGAE